MLIKIMLKGIAKKTIAALSFTALLCLPAQTIAALSLSDVPLFLSVSVPPNVVVTLDDSGSMALAYVPDNINVAAGTRRFASSYFNPIYYNRYIRYVIPTRHDAVTYTTSFTTARRNGFDASRGTLNLSNNYRVTFLYYNDTTNDTQQAQNPASDYPGNRNAGVAAYYYIYQASNNNCNGTKTDEDCYTRVVVGNNSGPNPATDPAAVDINGDGLKNNADRDERQNFANWYSFYRTRSLTTISGAMSAIGQVSDGKVRLAWQSLNATAYTSCQGFGTTAAGTCRGYTATNYDNRIRNLDPTHRSTFYNFLQRFSSDGGTPLRSAMIRAGQYFERSGVNSPYATNPQISSGTELSCRKNYHVLMTDGIWNSDTVTAYANEDNTSVTLGDGTSLYTPQSPYSDTNSNSVADIAFHFWRKDLRNLLNNVPPYVPDQSGTNSVKFWNPKNNPANWQHMVNFTVGLGLTGTLAAPATPFWGGSTYAGSYPDLRSGLIPWPATGANQTGNVADLWHAAINSRGQFFSAESPKEIGNAFQTILNSILNSSSSAAALAANSTSLQNAALIYQASFDSSDWSGHFKALPVQGDGSVGAALWDAASLLPVHGSRNILSHDGAGAITFEWTNLSAAQKAALNLDAFGVADAKGADRVDWLRGDASMEARNGGIFRNRFRTDIVNAVPVSFTTVLGDTVNSDPVYVRSEDYGYSSLSAGTPGQSTYASFVLGKSSRQPMIYVGANDGMLHGYRADSGNANSGREIFAYVPAAVYSNLSKLTTQVYSHKPFVDGTPNVGDAYIGGTWKSVLVGSLGGGGKAIFALNVSNPAAMGVGQVMWEYQDATDLGYTVGQPQIARLNNGTWAVIFGNGYNATSDQAFLYVVNLQTGALIRKIPAGGSLNNGLATPVLYDSNGDKTVDFVYAGDLQGNMWKFDLSGVGAGAWGVANSGQPLFTARNAAVQVQPITSQPRIGAHPNGGVIVHFGTGQYLTPGDVTATDVMSYYAIWDNGTPVTTTNRSQLQVQAILAETTEHGQDVRDTTANTVDWSIMRGWYMDMLPPSGTGGERITVRPLLIYDRVIFVTRRPLTDPCIPGGESWIMQLEAATGARYATPVFDINTLDVPPVINKGVFNASDNLANGNVVSGVKSTVGIASTPVFLTGTGGGFGGGNGEVGAIGSPIVPPSPSYTPNPTPDFAIISGTNGGTQSIGIAPPGDPCLGPSPPPSCGGGGGGISPVRVYWQQIL